jgi:hypothetical protein
MAGIANMAAGRGARAVPLRTASKAANGASTPSSSDSIGLEAEPLHPKQAHSDDPLHSSARAKVTAKAKDSGDNQPL